VRTAQRKKLIASPNRRLQAGTNLAKIPTRAIIPSVGSDSGHVPRLASEHRFDRGSHSSTMNQTPAERAARGKAARALAPRSSHADFASSRSRPDPIDLLQAQAEHRVPELVPVRYGRMLVSPLTFYRGAAIVMASDLASTPISGFDVQLCGDAHVANFGGFGSPERRLVFDINDFDETVRGPWEWDVKRFAASLTVAGRDNRYTAGERRNIVLAALGEYRSAMRDFASMGNLDLWYSSLDLDATMKQVQAQLDAKQLKRLRKDVAKARTHDSMETFQKLSVPTNDGPRIASRRPLIVPIEEFLPNETDRERATAELLRLVRTYRRTLETDRRHLLEQFELVHLARKLVGVGSVGTHDWIGLFLGRDGGDPFFLQIKEAQESVLEPFVGPSKYSNQGQRVVAGQRLMQATSDIFLGWDRVAPGLDGRQRDFYLRQLRNWKFSVEIGAMLPEGMAVYGRACAWTLARAHARSGDRIAIAAYLGRNDAFDRAINDFAEAYANQNERDYNTLVEAVNDGRVDAKTEV
jgi:uncharacterized protein (DUF2252 family)